MMNRLVIALVAASACAAHLTAQHLSSPRSTALGAYTAAARDVSAIDWNPAGLIFMRDWELRFNSYFEYRGGVERGPSFSDGIIGKRFSDRHAAAVRYAPGLTREFRISTDQLYPGFRGSPELLRQHLEYSQMYTFGYAHLFSPSLAAGVTSRYIQQKFTNPNISIAGDTLHLSQDVYEEPVWSLDAGLLYFAGPRLTLGLTMKNLISVSERVLPTEFNEFTINDRKYLRAGMMYIPLQDYFVAVDFDTRSRVQVGHEYTLTDLVLVRQGSFLNFERGKTFEAISGGVGLRFGTMDIDVSYLHFFDSSTRGRGALISSLIDHGIEDIGYNQFTGNRLDLSARLQLGKMYEPLVRIEYVEIMSDVYPAAYQVHAYRPIAKVRVRNISHRPIESRVGFFVDNLMERATETRPYYMMPGEAMEIPVTAVFSDAIKSIVNFTLQTAEVYVRATAAAEFDDRRQAHLAIYGRNDWNGDILTLRYFVTPDEPQVIQFTRNILLQHQDTLATVYPVLENYKKAKLLFDRFSRMMLYVNDPRRTHNRVQYPAETLDIRGGDCDDMAVAFASMLASIGIASAFIDVVPPGDPNNAHVYLLIDTGLEPENVHYITTNPKRYLIRRNEFGDETVWIPIETTVTQAGFDTAWDVGAETYYNEAILQGGIINGWVRIVDVPRL
jgi:transglutaminase-like putative cysteine protease